MKIAADQMATVRYKRPRRELDRLTQGEKFSGLLVGLLDSTLAATSVGFKAINMALKQPEALKAGTSWPGVGAPRPMSALGH